MRVSSLFACLICAVQTVFAHAQAVPLPTYNIDINQTSISGLSSGAFMAVQFGVAYSAIVKGVGVMAGGPYYCAKDSQQTAQSTCMAASSPININDLIRITDQNAQAGAIDATSNMSGQRIWLFSGTQDSVVKQSVENDLQRYYQHYLSSSNIFYKNNVAAGHAVPTDSYGNPCSATTDPFINNCAYDGAGELLKWIYGSLNPPNTGTLHGTVIEFDQSEFISNPNSHSMANSGWVYVPDNCKNGAACKLHIAFHGCKQFPSYQYFGGGGMVRFSRTFVNNAGYNRWADTNNIVVLYPQTTNGSGNPLGCWDGGGYDDPNYAKKSGRQMAAVGAMVKRLASPVLPAPQGLATTAIHDNDVSLTWNAVNGASKYAIYRNGSEVGQTSPGAGTQYTDNGLAPGTPYVYQVSGIDASGRQGNPSAALNVKTTGTPPPVDPPTSLTTGNVSGSSVSLSWTAAANVAGYNVRYKPKGAGNQYVKANSNLIAATSYTVGGLNPGTTYTFVVQSQNSAGALSADSNEVTATTSAATACYTASNFAHVRAGRAHDSGGVALANGSNMRMGLDNVFVVTTLKETRPNFYVIDHLTCP